ncbi:hypothetical protein V8D89_012534 [Ganoderma adspersum]
MSTMSEVIMWKISVRLSSRRSSRLHQRRQSCMDEFHVMRVVAIIGVCSSTITSADSRLQSYNVWGMPPQSGPRAAPTWTVSVFYNRIEYGRGCATRGGVLRTTT